MIFKGMDEQNNQNQEAESAAEKNDLQKCETERKEYLDGWQRAKADYLNYKKDEGKRFEDMARFVTTGLIQDIFPILDSFDLALQSMHTREGQSAGHEQGILLIRSQFMDMLKRRGVSMMEVRPGEKFNPERHEIIGEIEAEFSPGSIAEEIQKGYIFHDRVLRPARVRIVKAKE